VVRGALLKGVGMSETWPSLLALAAFVGVVGAISIARYRTTLD
jgi:ABC-2 type transport system permease protein